MAYFILHEVGFLPLQSEKIKLLNLKEEFWRPRRISKGGYSNVNCRLIALRRTAGCGDPALHLHFLIKRELLRAGDG
jgi:hypothetical protein